MTETLTYDSGTDTVTVGDNLTPDEQDSLQVGEAMVEQQEQMLAGKYKDAQELEKAYIELEKKLGSNEKEENKAETEQEEVLPEESEESSEERSEAATLIQEATSIYNDSGEISDDMMSKFSQMSSQDLVNAYVELSKTQDTPNVAPVAAEDLTDGEVNSIKNSVGGEAEYNNMVEWCSSNLPPNTVEAFDSLINSGNAGAIQLAVNGLRQQYEQANGYEGRMLSGKPPKTSGEVFRSQPELVAAMSDPRYDRDPAYRQDVMEKLDRSDLAF